MAEVKEKKEEKPEVEQKPEEKKLKEPIKVRDIILVALTNLERKAWAYLGLVSHMETGEIKKDLHQARLAIDAVSALYEVIKGELAEQDRKTIELALTNLRLNFVKEKP